VLNELLDAPYDRKHPVKKHRPAAAEKVRRRYALAEWLALGAIGIGLGLLVNKPFAATALSLWVMGVVYNVKPVRSKELPYLDVLSESVNNPIRLLLGWLPLIQDKVPPLSLVFSYWMVGAFFMALKRFAEYRTIGDRATAIRYRRSFKHYDEERLLVSVFFYAVTAALFAGVFIVRYHLELILGIPVGAGFLAWYLKLGLQKDSPVQNPERLYRERGFLVYTLACLALFVLLMFVSIPAL
jgi:4-hydroxybenzoate polyprenyltransferase